MPEWIPDPYSSSQTDICQRRADPEKDVGPGWKPSAGGPTSAMWVLR